MATLRDLRNKIRSIGNTKKITRTMEMIATAKALVCQKRIEAVQPYGDKLAELLRDLGEAEGSYGSKRRVEPAIFVEPNHQALLQSVKRLNDFEIPDCHDLSVR